ncbi:hypothetical protein V8E36_003665 [Tilletia maclaganii]
MTNSCSSNPGPPVKAPHAEKTVKRLFIPKPSPGHCSSAAELAAEKETQIVLMVDADTKVFPDSLSRMVACMVEDTEIMALCGETKIANQSETWVTMIEVFEYYISHHQTKAFEACFGVVTCLPGCFTHLELILPSVQAPPPPPTPP